METILVVVHLLLSMAVIGLVLPQHGRGADAGAAFGSGASATVFGARGSASFLSRSTAILAAMFFATSLAMAYISTQRGEVPGIMDKTRAATQGALLPERSVEIPEMRAPTPPTTTEVPLVPAAPAKESVNKGESKVISEAGAQAKSAASGEQQK